ncbi:unnamed protein product [Leptidea sinapis]|uniref:Uncharacterized protein n=1 Tax=Leptidea sinapis TaxID=189913 RepID=A0A5E4R8K4_9NEOP|nr:unnamed protein product [Leptidea sinapis]
MVGVNILPYTHVSGALFVTYVLPVTPRHSAALTAMSITCAVANAAAAAAAAAGAGKKAAQVQLQAELNNDDDWNKFLAKDGLLVSSRKAKADTIQSLKRFRNRSEPTWMLIANSEK